MSSNWFKDMQEMHEKYGVPEWMANATDEEKRKFLKFRLDFIDEERKETWLAFDEKDPEEVVDGLIDLCVIAIGTLEAFGVDANKAWDEVYRANMGKEIGVKPTRPNPLGLPDLIKPEGWQGPSHEGNHAQLTNTLQ